MVTLVSELFFRKNIPLHLVNQIVLEFVFYCFKCQESKNLNGKREANSTVFRRGKSSFKHFLHDNRKIRTDCVRFVIKLSSAISAITLMPFYWHAKCEILDLFSKKKLILRVHEVANSFLKGSRVKSTFNGLPWNLDYQSHRKSYKISWILHCHLTNYSPFCIFPWFL